MSGAEVSQIRKELQQVQSGPEVAEVMINATGGIREDLFTLREGYVKPTAELRANDTTVFAATLPKDRNAEQRPAPEVVVAVKGIGKLAELSIFATQEAQQDPRIIKGAVACALAATGTSTAKLDAGFAVGIREDVLAQSGFTQEANGGFGFDQKPGMAIPLEEAPALHLVTSGNSHESQLAA